MIITLITLFICTGTVLGEEWRIINANDFISFVNNVNNGNYYLGTTVYLDSDLSLSSYSSLNPIGTSSSYCFRGIFDGQGHVLSGLTISSSSLNYVGLFGRSTGLTIKNVILDRSCSFKSSYIGSGNSFVGGIIGYCSSCIIESCTNMASVTFSGSSSNYLHLGGIAGFLSYYSSFSSSSTVKNCASYGHIVHPGITESSSHIGGIVGYSYGSSSNHNYIQNCINYGTINHSEETSNMRVGGIIGRSYYTYIENCVSVGRITNSVLSNIGSVVGYVDSNTYLNYCYFTNDVGINKLYGTGSPSSTNDSSPSPVSVDSTLIINLNNQATNKGWNKWTMLHLNGGKINDVNQEMIVATGKYFPDPVKEGNPFLFWCVDASCAVKYDPKTTDISGISDLYAHWSVNTYIVTYDVNGGNEFTPSSKKVTFDSTYGELTNPTRTGYNFTGWYTDKDGGSKIESSTPVTTADHHTIYAHWSVNKYTVTYDVNGGNELTTKTKKVTFDSTYGELADPTRTGYDFAGWYTDKDGNDKIESSTKVTTADHHTIYAHWSANTYTITFDFDNGTEPEIRSFAYNTNIIYPDNPTKEGHLFSGWNNNITTMPAYNLTIKAKWVTMNYTVTFDVNGGDELVNNKVKVTFNSTYSDLPVPTREGYLFVGWFNEDEIITSETIVNKTDDHILHARWKENVIQEDSTSSIKETPTSQVEITFSTKDLSKEDIVSIIKQYTNENFTIVGFEDTSDEIKVIVKFNDYAKAEEFVRIVRSTDGSTTKSLIKRVDFNSIIDVSLSSSLLIYHFLLFIIIVL